MPHSVRSTEVFMTPEQVVELRVLSERVVLTYGLVDWGGSTLSFEQSHSEFKAAMRELEAFFKKVKAAEKSD